MRLSDLGDKELVNLNSGGRLGLLADADLVFEEDSGKIISLLVQDRKVAFKLFGVGGSEKEIPWSAIRKIGYDMIIVELEP